MHDLLIALVFLGMVVCPAIVAAVPRNDTEDDGSPAGEEVAP
jgi:hypothetical protein